MRNTFTGILKSQRDAKRGIDVSLDPTNIIPGRALVFEIAGSVRKFAERAQQLDGFEFLFDEDEELTPDDDFYYTTNKGVPKGGKATLYAVMPSEASLRRLVRRFQEYSRGEKLKGVEAYRDLFDQLIELRAWGPQDRLPEQTRTVWEDFLEGAPDGPVRFEAELIYRQNADDRRAAELALREAVADIDGRVVSRSEISEIRYHSALVEAPAIGVQSLLDDDRAQLVVADDLFMLRPEPSAMFPVGEDDTDENIEAREPEAELELGTPVAAVFDGVPMQAHQLLRDHLVVEDPWDLQAEVPVEARAHGTGMASLVIHGDLNGNGDPIERQLISQALMTAEQNFLGQWHETLPKDRLPTDVLYEAVLRLKAGYGGQDPTHPSVVIINHSLGDYSRPYTSHISPWAKLLDWLAYRYRLLIIVSAGNIRESIRLDEYPTLMAFEDADPDEREQAIANAIVRDRNARSLLSPAEAVNALTVGAAHADELPITADAGGIIDPKPSGLGSNILSAIGNGYAGCIKPDLMVPGGRQLVRGQISDDVCYANPVHNAGRVSGQGQARPSDEGNAVWNKCGTSNAAALTTRAAIELYDVLEDLGDGAINTIVADGYEAVVLKALLIHGTSWGDAEAGAATILKDQFGHAAVAARKEATRLTGYGQPDFERVKACTARRATTISYGELRKEQEALIELPLPPSLESMTEIRSLHVTLAWLTPINTRFSGYRRAKLTIDPVDEPKVEAVIGGPRQAQVQPDYNHVKKGTVTHEIFSGGKATPFIHDGKLRLRVACPNPTDQDLDDPVPFAVITSLEVGENSTIAVYDEVKVGIDELVRVREDAPA